MFPLILLYLVLVLIRPQDYPALAQAHLQLLPGTLIACALCWLFSRDKTFAAPQYLLLPAFLLAMMLSEVRNGWLGGVFVQVISFGPVLIAFVLLANATNTTRRMLIAMSVFVLCSTVLAVHGVEQAHTGVGWTGVHLIQDGRIQYVGIFNDPNDLGLLFALTLPMAIYLSSLGGWGGLKRLFWLASAALLLYGIYLTDSRGAMLAVALVGGIYLWRTRGLVVAVLLGSVGLAGMMMLPSRLQDLSPDEASANGRVDAWYEGIHMFISHPLFGVGAGNFTDYNFLTAHNSFVLVLAETGFVGFTLWLGFVFYCFWMTLTVLRHQPEFAGDDEKAGDWKMQHGIAMTLLLSLCGCLGAAFFLSRSYTVVMYLLAALVVAAYANARRQFPSLPRFELGRDSLRLAMHAAIGAVALFIITKFLLAF